LTRMQDSAEDAATSGPRLQQWVPRFRWQVRCSATHVALSMHLMLPSAKNADRSAQIPWHTKDEASRQPHLVAMQSRLLRVPWEVTTGHRQRPLLVQEVVLELLEVHCLIPRGEDLLEALAMVELLEAVSVELTKATKMGRTRTTPMSHSLH